MHDLNTIRRLNAQAVQAITSGVKTERNKVIVVEKAGLHVIDHHVFDDRARAERFAFTVNQRGDSSSARILN